LIESDNGSGGFALVLRPYRFLSHFAVARQDHGIGKFAGRRIACAGESDGAGLCRGKGGGEPDRRRL
jgi:hypothetical protein